MGTGGSSEAAGDRIDERDAGGGGADFFLLAGGGGAGPRLIVGAGGVGASGCNNWCRCGCWRGRRGRFLLNRPTFTR